MWVLNIWYFTIKCNFLLYLQGEHKVFPWLETFITRKLRGHVGTLSCTSVRRVSAVDNFPTRWCTSTLGFICSSVFGCNISKQVDWERWSDTLATTIAGYHPPWLLFGLCKAQSVFDTSSRYYKFEGKNNKRFCYNNWRHVGEHVQSNWLSIRHSPSNKSSTCWSVLMCCE